MVDDANLGGEKLKRGRRGFCVTAYDQDGLPKQRACRSELSYITCSADIISLSGHRRRLILVVGINKALTPIQTSAVGDDYESIRCRQ